MHVVPPATRSALALQPPNVPVLTVQRMWLSSRQRNRTDVTLVTQLSGAAAACQNPRYSTHRKLAGDGAGAAPLCPSALVSLSCHLYACSAPSSSEGCTAEFLGNDSVPTMCTALLYCTVYCRAADRLYMLEGQCGSWGSIISAAVHVALVDGKIVSGG